MTIEAPKLAANTTLVKMPVLVVSIPPANTLAFSFYAAGPLQSYPAQPTPDFGMYWLLQPPVDTNQLAQGIQHLYGYMSKFFHDEGQPYRVFIRKNFNHSNGGTALARSFTFGWSEARAPTLDSLQSLLAHEMTHNWPAMEGEHGDRAWYSEGAAEYYSILLSHRAGVRARLHVPRTGRRADSRQVQGQAQSRRRGRADVYAQEAGRCAIHR